MEVCGIPVADDPIGVRTRIGYMPEHDCLPLDQTAADVVATFGELGGLPVRAARQRASEVLDLVGLDEARFRPVGGFSTGMRQRTKLAQAIVADPDLVLLDEPTAGLDPSGREEMLALVDRLGTFDIAVVLATHLLDDVARVCDHVVMLDAGRLVTDAPTETLLQQTGTVTVDVGPAAVDTVAGGLDRPGPGRGARRRRRPRGDGDRRRRPRHHPRRRGRPRPAPAPADQPAHVAGRRLRPPGADRVTATGAVYDRGYRPYEGRRGGRRAATAALYRTSLRRAIGLRRPWRQKVAPAVLLAIAAIPAVINVGVGYLTRGTPAEGFEFITYREYLGVSSALLLFVALVAPDIVCPDRRQRVLPLIFARPLTGRDYALAKVGAIFTCVFAFSFLPQVVLYVGQMLVSDGALDYLADNTAVLWQVPVAAAMLALFYSLLGRGRGVVDRPADRGRGDAAGHHAGLVDRVDHPRAGRHARAGARATATSPPC